MEYLRSRIGLLPFEMINFELWNQEIRELNKEFLSCFIRNDEYLVRALDLSILNTTIDKKVIDLETRKIIFWKTYNARILDSEYEDQFHGFTDRYDLDFYIRDQNDEKVDRLPKRYVFSEPRNFN